MLKTYDKVTQIKNSVSSTHLVWNFKWYSLAWIYATHQFLVALLLNFNHFCPICSRNFWRYIPLLSWQIFFSKKFSWSGFQYGVIARLIDGVWNVVAPSRVNLTSIRALKSVGCFNIQNLNQFPKWSLLPSPLNKTISEFETAKRSERKNLMISM